MNLNLSGEIALVTGASRGIGQGVAVALGKAGAEIIGTATTSVGAKGITQNFKKQGICGEGVVLNIADSDATQAVLERLGTKKPSILVNNAGITQDNLLVRMKDDEWDKVINTNLSGVYRLSKACLRAMMKARYGRIITISSIIGMTGNAGQSNYAAAKAGVIAFSKSLAKEVGSRGITVNVIAPGFIDTQMTHVLSEQQRTAILEHIPLGHIGEVDDVASAVVFLASKTASYITGETLHINGGMYMP